MQGCQYVTHQIWLPTTMAGLLRTFGKASRYHRQAEHRLALLRTPGGVVASVPSAVRPPLPTTNSVCSPATGERGAHNVAWGGMSPKVHPPSLTPHSRRGGDIQAPLRIVARPSPFPPAFSLANSR